MRHRRGRNDAAESEPQTPVPYTYVDTAETLALCVRELKGARLIGLDTEFVGEHTYHPRLALIQLWARGVVWLIDPLALSDLSPLCAPLSQPKCIIVMHDAEIDTQVVQRATGATLPNPFDSQLAAAFVGLPECSGLATLVATLMGKRLSKGQQVSDWLKRPLSEKQLRYAAEDVLYLDELHRVLSRKLKRLDRVEPFTQELQERRLRWLSPMDLEQKFKGFLDAPNLTERQFTALKNLLIWREKTAQARDVPRRHVLADDSLTLIAMGLPASFEELKGYRQVSERAIKRHGQEIVEIIVQAQQAPAERRPQPRHKRLSGEGVTARLPFVKMAAEMLAATAQIAPGLIARAKEVEEICRHALRSPAPPDLPSLQGWRGELVGQKLWRFARGEFALRLNADPKGPAVILEETSTRTSD